VKIRTVKSGICVKSDSGELEIEIGIGNVAGTDILHIYPTFGSKVELVQADHIVIKRKTTKDIHPKRKMINGEEKKDQVIIDRDMEE